MKLAPLLGAALFAAAAQPGRAQDAAAGEKIYTQCRACHQVGETARNTVGPILNGVIGQKAGAREGYGYSAAMKDSGLSWDDATFSEYIQNPRGKVPGTKMIYAGLKDEKRIADLLAYLRQFDAEGKKRQ